VARPRLARLDDPGQSRLVLAVGAAEASQPGDLVVHSGLLQQQRVARRQRLHLGVREGLLADVVHLATGDVAAHHLVDERRLPLRRLPHEDVEGAFGDVAQDRHLGVLVPLAQGTPIALLV
jgi:hypothetical protein